MFRKWYALAVQPRKESYVQKQLASARYENVCPRYAKVVRHARRTTKVLVPLFPGYVFVSLENARNDWREVNYTRGAIGLIKSNGFPQALDEDFVDEFILGQNPKGSAKFRSKLNLGDRVVAVGGLFDSLNGEVIDFRGSERVTILMNALNRKIETDLPRDSVVRAA